MHSSESANVRVENIFNMQNNITRGTNFKYRRAVILYIPYEHDLFQLHNCKYPTWK
jgi:hypothetical protein